MAVGEQSCGDQPERRIGADDGPPDRGPQVLPQAPRGMLIRGLRRRSRRRGLDVDVRGGLLGRSGLSTGIRAGGAGRSA
jgi:hypothetical protein